MPPPLAEVKTFLKCSVFSFRCSVAGKLARDSGLGIRGSGPAAPGRHRKHREKTFSQWSKKPGLAPFCSLVKKTRCPLAEKVGKSSPGKRVT